MRIGLVVSGGVDRSGRDRVTPSLLWLVERLARRHDLQVFVLHYYPQPCSYPLLGALRVASINEVKDYPTLLQALAVLVGRGVDVQLDVVGEDFPGVFDIGL